MPTTDQALRLARIESGAAATGHVGVIVYRDPAEVPRLLAEAERAGRIAPNYGVLMLPADADEATWEVRAHDYFARQPKP